MSDPNIPVPLEFQTRLLYPFLLRRGAVPQAVEALLAARSMAFEGGDGLSLWQQAEPEEYYREEVLDHSLDYLFSHHLATGCAYLRLDDAVANQWFPYRKLEVVLPRLSGLPERILHLKAPVQIEMFLSNHGVGVLSLLLMPELPHNAALSDTITAFNYLLAHPYRHHPALFRWPHRNTDEATWQRLPEDARRAIPPSPDRSLMVLQRIGREGSEFTLAELIYGDCLLQANDVSDPDALLQYLRADHPFADFLRANPYLNSLVAPPQQQESDGEAQAVVPTAQHLADALNRILRDRQQFYAESRFPSLALPPEVCHQIDLHPRGTDRLRLNRALLDCAFPNAIVKYTGDHLLTPLEPLDLMRAQDRFSVYTAVRYDETADLSEAVPRAALARTLAALTQIEEPGHAGAVPELPGLANSLQNRRHWAAVGMLGAAHLCADQPDHHPFNRDRLPHLMRKYFVPYLMALLQRLTLQKLTDEANEVVLDPQRATADAISALREHLLAFQVNGLFPQISSREALHRYYRLCQEGLDVQRSLESLQRAFAEIDARQSDARQLEIATNLHASAKATEEVQRATEEHLDTVAGVQVKLEVLEVLIFAVYGGELGHLLLPEEHTRPEQFLYVLGGTLIGAIIGLLILKPSWEHFKTHWRGHGRAKHPHQTGAQPIAEDRGIRAALPKE